MSGELVRLLRGLGVAALHEAAGRAGQADPGLRPVLPGYEIAGRALTARCQAGDNLAITGPSRPRGRATSSSWTRAAISPATGAS